jgi:hypothetical protein
MGASGSGKTYALPTYIEAGLELFVLITEPGGAESLVDSCKARGLPIDKLHWTTCLPATQGWSGLNDVVTKISAMDFESLSKIKTGVGKEHTREAAMHLLRMLANFKCERTGKEFGDVTTWDDTRAFALDSLSGLSAIAWALTVGHKPTAHMGEWNIAMNFISDLLMKLTADRRCHFTLTAHVEKETNEITGVNQIMASTLGRKLAPKIPRFFSEVVYAQRTAAAPNFRWSTIDSAADLKNRALPVSATLEPSFIPIVDAYNRRLKAAKATTTASAA